MDFSAAMETFAEAWVAANTQTAVNADPQGGKSSAVSSSSSSALEDLPTLLPREQMLESRNSGAKTSPPRQSDSSLPSSGVKLMPIHCLVEQAGGRGDEGGGGGTVEKEDYAILPSTTLFRDVVRTALIKLGYQAPDSLHAKGALSIRNWKLLPFEAVTDNPQASVEDILGELGNVVTLRIRLASTERNWPEVTQWDDQAVRTAVLELLREMTQSKLAKLSPLCQSMISNVANGRSNARLSQEKCREFATWFLQFRQQQPSQGFPKGEGDKASRDLRITFHPEHEVPLLRTWFTACTQPTEEELQHFAGELNRGHVRQERPPVTPDKLRLWWKNEKQKRRRDQRRQHQPYPTSASGSRQRHVTSPERPLRDSNHDPILTSGSLTSGSQSPLGFPGLLQEGERSEEM